mmetsp:Transcript_62493/g.140933  ORF Transcript_62493/g.140933 Transcript_62493/m.140933 type:complete len:226 (-) Transcript_62493:661-1338(-)
MPMHLGGQAKEGIWQVREGVQQLRGCGEVPEGSLPANISTKVKDGKALGLQCPDFDLDVEIMAVGTEWVVQLSGDRVQPQEAHHHARRQDHAGNDTIIHRLLEGRYKEEPHEEDLAEVHVGERERRGDDHVDALVLQGQVMAVTHHILGKSLFEAIDLIHVPRDLKSHPDEDREWHPQIRQTVHLEVALRGSQELFDELGRQHRRSARDVLLADNRNQIVEILKL